MNTNLLLEVALLEDATKNGEGLDAKVLVEAMKVEDSSLTEPLSGADFLLELAKEGLV